MERFDCIYISEADEKVKLSLCEIIFSAAINSETGTTYLLL